jgi:hypothetical protein
MNASHCPAFLDLFGEGVDCERQLHADTEEHRAVVYAEAYPGGESAPVTVRWGGSR